MPHLLGGHENSRLFQEFAEKFVAKPVGHAELSSESEIIMMVVTTLLILASMSLAYFIYVKNDKEKMRDRLKEKFLFLWTVSSNKFMVDELYETVIIKPLYAVGNFLVDIVETHIINGVIKVVVKGTTETSQFLDDNKPDRIDLGILYTIIGLTILITAIFNVFKF